MHPSFTIFSKKFKRAVIKYSPLHWLSAVIFHIYNKWINGFQILRGSTFHYNITSIRQFRADCISFCISDQFWYWYGCSILVSNCNLLFAEVIIFEIACCIAFSIGWLQFSIFYLCQVADQIYLKSCFFIDLLRFFTFPVTLSSVAVTVIVFPAVTATLYTSVFSLYPVGQ